MQYSSKLKGSLLALFATISYSNVYIFSKMALQDISLASFGILWFGFALFYNSLYYYFFSERTQPNQLSPKSKGILFLIGISELISVSAFFLAISLSENPAIVSFLANTSPIFVIFISFIFLKTRYNLLAIIGIIVTLAGVFLINYSDSRFSWNQFLTPSSVATLIFAFFYALSLVLTRSAVKTIPLLMITICRTLFLFLGFVFYNLIIWEIPYYSTNSIIYTGIGSILGPFLGITLTFGSLKYVDASVTTLIGTSRSLFIVLGAFIFMNIFPTEYQLWGGIFTIVGIVIISIADITNKQT
ncbi:DMT family transporter [Labilibaculum antarcticum]|uniref:EamA family transporter n=1 Tax=Labilibaculum antarcticum TaxID=1717717 RepID=A0A1Y1CKA5_9BACT|nr:DMT family transporter [Labilibaculum antarcticum]BAX79691.1 EamA family transporter [Labilibaculum antarcticum]